MVSCYGKLVGKLVLCFAIIVPKTLEVGIRLCPCKMFGKLASVFVLANCAAGNFPGDM